MKLQLPMSVWPMLLACALCVRRPSRTRISPRSARRHRRARNSAPAANWSCGFTRRARTSDACHWSHGEAWLPDSTHLIPVKLNEALDPRNVVRFALYYRAGSPLAPAWEVVSADVELPSGHEASAAPARRDLVGRDREARRTRVGGARSGTMACSSDADCDDHRACNGKERCAPHTPGADARGCVKGTPVVCPVNQVCGEGVGCHGTKLLKKFSSDASTSKK